MGESKGPIFIGGSGRCGTTLLGRILSRHSRVYVPVPETHFIIHRDGLLGLVGAISTQWSPWVADVAVRRFEELMKRKLYLRPMKKTIWKLDRALDRVLGRTIPLAYLSPRLDTEWEWGVYSSYVDEFVGQLVVETYTGRWFGSPSWARSVPLVGWVPRTDALRWAAQFADRLFAYRVVEEGKNVWCEHSPFNCLHAGFLREMFPEMRLVYLFRDPRDVVSSYVRQPWAPKRPGMAARWLSAILKRWDEEKERMPAKSYLEVRFESLIRDPQLELQRICGFLDVEVERQMSDLDLSRHNIGRWQGELPPADAQVVQDCLRPYIDRHWIGR